MKPRLMLAISGNYRPEKVDLVTRDCIRITINTPAMPRIPQGTLHKSAGFLFIGVYQG